MASRVKPLGDRVVLKPSQREEVTKSGIVLPDTTRERPQEGIVIAAGPGRIEDGKRVPMDVKEGDRVFYAKFSGQDIKVDEEELLIVAERDLLAVVTPE